MQYNIFNSLISLVHIYDNSNINTMGINPTWKRATKRKEPASDAK